MACAGETAATTSDIKDTLICPICLEVYTTPRALACLHTFCELCIHAHIMKLAETCYQNSKICCPICRVSSAPPVHNKLPSEWAKLLPMNYAILPILETIHSRQTKERYCESCSDADHKVPAIKYCSDCQQTICGDCFDCHKKYKRLQAHTISELCDISTYIKRNEPTVDVEFCEEHSDEDIKFFCADHSVLLCGSCVIIRHRTCRKVTGIKELGEGLKTGDALTRLQTELKMVQPVIAKITSAIEDNDAQIKAEAGDLPLRVMKLKKRAMQVFDDLYAKVLTQSSTLKKEQTLQLSEDAFNCKSLVAAVESSSLMLSDVQEHGSATRLFITVHKLEQQLKCYEKSIVQLVANLKFSKLTLQLDGPLEMFTSTSPTGNVLVSDFTPVVIADMKKLRLNCTPTVITDLKQQRFNSVISLRHMAKRRAIQELYMLIKNDI